MGTIDKIKIMPGLCVLFQDEKYIVKRILDLKTILIESLTEKSVIERVPIKDVIPCTDNDPTSSPELDLNLIPQEEWKVAQYRYAIIRPILAGEIKKNSISDFAKDNGVHLSTIYRWIKLFNATHKISSLAPTKQNGGKGQSRLPEDVEQIILETIQSTYLNRDRKSINRTIEEIKLQCWNKGIVAPHSNTIRMRLNTISDEEKIKQRYGAKIARLAFDPTSNKYQEATFPLSVVQIDHTKVDIVLVEEQFRHPIGRPWITLAIDVFSRMVLGFYISFDPPGALGTGMCLANAILPKEVWLEKLGINSDWPCWGVMKTIHADNAKEFRGNMLRKASEEYGINLEWRPVTRPNWGGHIERLLGTLSKEIHDLSGTTFSNPTEKSNYDSQKNAVLTLKEFESWLLTLIVNIYHNRLHSGLGTTPLAKYKEGVFGSATQLASGLPDRIYNERKLKLDFLPYEERTIQEYGVQIDNIQYYHNVLRKWVNSIERSSGKAQIRRKFIFKRDPRDISVIFFYDPDLKEYFEIPYRNTSHPAITIWEYREIERILLDEGKKNIDENAIFEGYHRLREIESNAKGKTKEIKRHIKSTKREYSMSNSILKTTSNESSELDITDNNPIEDTIFVAIKPYDDLEMTNN